MTQTLPQSVLVLGGGTAGLTAAYRLARQGLRVTLLEQASILGGNPAHADAKGPFILGCHRATWNLLRSLRSCTDRRLFYDTPLEFCLPDGRLVRYPQSRLPSPLHIASRIGRFAALPWTERWKLLSRLEALWEGSHQLDTDLEHRTAADWVASLGQPESLQRSVWNPLARWLTGTELHIVSAEALVLSLKPFLLQHASDNRIITLEQSWETLFIKPIVDLLNQRGAFVRLESPVLQFHYEQERMTGVRTVNGTLEADWYVSALPHARLMPLLPERWLSRYAYFQQIGELTTQPCTVVHITARRAQHRSRLVLFHDDHFRWVQAQSSADSQTSFSLVKTGTGTQELTQQARALLESVNMLDASAPVTAVRTSEIPQAFLALPPGTKTRRPIQKSPIGNLLVAGAWTDTGWPANLESAIVSGERCADFIAEKTTNAH